MLIFQKKIKYYKQQDKMDCGPTCLRIISHYYGKDFSIKRIKEVCDISRLGASLLDISTAAESLGFEATSLKLNIDELTKCDYPVLLHWQKNHFVILFRISGAKGKRVFHIADPAAGKLILDEVQFKRNWLPDDTAEKGISLHLLPQPEFFKIQPDKTNKIGFLFIAKYLKAYRKVIIQLFIGLGVTSMLQVVFPFLTQQIVDVGIKSKDLSFIYIILIAQLTLLLGRMAFEFLRSWLLLYISVRLNLRILTDFLYKLMKLPMSFFETRMTGDILQRINDQKRIESFLTGSSINIIFSFFSLFMLSIVLIRYSFIIFIIFFVATILYVIWLVSFLVKRKSLDFERFGVAGMSQSHTIQMIHGMQDIKLNNYEKEKRWEWERLQLKVFNNNIKGLILNQKQQLGSFVLNEGKNILITFLTAKYVIDGSLSIGSMVAIQYITGQMTGPVNQMIGFIQSYQDAQISFERMNELETMKNEDDYLLPGDHTLPPGSRSIELKNISFIYPGAGGKPVLNNLSIHIPEGKVTAIVGPSGSGKTTVLKLLLRFYDLKRGNIFIGNKDLSSIDHKAWRSISGAVMQDGYIFTESIKKNICQALEYDETKLDFAIRSANLTDYIDSLPNGLETVIGADGSGLSQGQKQRVLIARMIYKNPQYIFMDEATNSLDSSNEKIIMDNIERFFAGKTIVIIAHRLSTIRNADNIILLREGKIAESGTHDELIQKAGYYAELFLTQLEKQPV